MKPKAFLTFISFAICLYIAITQSFASEGNVKIEYERDLSFGVVVKPSSKVKIVVSESGSIAAGTTATVLGSSFVSSGSLTIKGNNENSIDISFENCASNSSSGIEISDFKAKYAGVSFTDNGFNLPAPSEVGVRLNYGASLNLNPFVSAGNYSPCYYVNVSYQ